MRGKTILLADDHPLILKGLYDFLVKEGFDVISCESKGIHAHNKIINLKPSIAIIDIEMPDMSGLEIVEKLANQKIKTNIIFNTIHKENSIIQKAVELGVKGYLLKEYALEEIIACILAVSQGKTFFGKDLSTFTEPANEENFLGQLSPSEIKILRLIAQENNTKEIAEKLFIAEKTVEKHRSNIIRKLALSPTKNSLLIWSIQNKEELLKLFH